MGLIDFRGQLRYTPLLTPVYLIRDLRFRLATSQHQKRAHARQFRFHAACASLSFSANSIRVGVA